MSTKTKLQSNAELELRPLREDELLRNHELETVVAGAGDTGGIKGRPDVSVWRLQPVRGL